MSNAVGNVVIAGDRIYAGIDEGDVTKLTLSVVIEFKSAAEIRKAFKEKTIDLTFFEVSDN